MPLNRDKALDRLLVGMILLVWLSLQAAEPAGAAANFDSALKPLFEEHCVTCYGEKKQKGNFRIDTLAPDLSESSPCRLQTMRSATAYCWQWPETILENQEAPCIRSSAYPQLFAPNQTPMSSAPGACLDPVESQRQLKTSFLCQA